MRRYLFPVAAVLAGFGLAACEMDQQPQDGIFEDRDDVFQQEQEQQRTEPDPWQQEQQQEQMDEPRWETDQPDAQDQDWETEPQDDQPGGQNL